MIRIASVRILVTIAFAWSVAMSLLLAFAPVYKSADTAGNVSGGPSLVGQNGLYVLVILAIPLVITGFPFYWSVRRKTSVFHKTLMLALSVILIAGCVLTIVSIGFVFAPAALLFLIAAVFNTFTPHPERVNIEP